MKYFIPTAIFALTTLIPAGLWAGAITPTITVTARLKAAVIQTPQFNNATNVREWPSEIGHSGPSLRNSKGLFTFAPGNKMLGSLLASAASATTVDGSIRQTAKFDNSRYTYNGRSYGVGSIVGLTDNKIAANPLALSYSYLEHGLRADVTCIYNSSARFVIDGETLINIYAVTGYLPNSGGSKSYSEYYGHSSDAIVAIGVTGNSASTERMLGIAAGSDYATLNATQCTFDFVPRTFNVSVNIRDRSINVSDHADAPTLAASTNLTYALVRQFELISNDQTNLYVSLLGDSFNSSIASYESFVASNGSQSPPDEKLATLIGLTNSLTAMTDDLLVAYSSAQLMIMNDTSPVQTFVRYEAFRYGTAIYIYLTFAINIVIVLLLLEEAMRTRGWRNLLYFDYMDPRSLIISSSMGGCAIAHAAKEAWTDRKESLYHYGDTGIGNVRIAMHENHRSIVLDTSTSHQKQLPKIANVHDED